MSLSANNCMYPSIKKRGRLWWRKWSCSGIVGIFHALFALASSLKWYVSCQYLDDDGLLFSITECFWGRTSDLVLRMNIVQFWLLSQIVCCWEGRARKQGSNSWSKQQKREWRTAQANLSFAELESVWVLYCTDSEISTHVTVSEPFPALD